MRVLVAHNRYQQPGGEDTVYAAEAALLEERGHVVVRYEADSDDVAAMGRGELALATLWNARSYRDVRALIRRTRPDVLHAHNTFPLISPAVYYAARAEDVPVVQTLHNYRLVCPSAVLFRAGAVCEACVGRAVALPGVAHACYRRSRVQSLAVASMLAIHRAARTWSDAVGVYVALTEGAREVFVRGGLPADRVVVKPNFVHPDPGVGAHGGGFALFVGRVAEEKGVGVLLEAWRRLGADVPLKVVGDGPLRRELEALGTPGVEWLGPLDRGRVLQLMQDARFLVVPSVWREPFGMVVAEAFAVGLPAVVSDVGALGELVEHRGTGLRFAAGSADALAAQVRWLLEHPEVVPAMGAEARRVYAARFTADANYGLLLGVYERAVAQRRSATTPVPVGPRLPAAAPAKR